MGRGDAVRFVADAPMIKKKMCVTSSQSTFKYWSEHSPWMRGLNIMQLEKKIFIKMYSLGIMLDPDSEQLYFTLKPIRSRSRRITYSGFATPLYFHYLFSPSSDVSQPPWRREKTTLNEYWKAIKRHTSQVRYEGGGKLKLNWTLGNCHGEKISNIIRVNFDMEHNPAKTIWVIRTREAARFVSFKR